MAVKLIGTTSGIELDVETTPKAAKTILYDAAGNALQPNAVYSGLVPVKVRQTATTAAAAVVWGLYNSSSTKIVHVRRLWLEMFFDGTSAATSMEYEMGRMTGITTFSGGTLVTPMHKLSSQSGAQVSAARVLDTGLTTTGGTFQAQGWLGRAGRITVTATLVPPVNLYPVIDTALGIGIPVELVQNEALVFRQLVTSVIGDRLQGYVDFAEV